MRTKGEEIIYKYIVHSRKSVLLNARLMDVNEVMQQSSVIHQKESKCMCWTFGKLLFDKLHLNTLVTAELICSRTV